MINPFRAQGLLGLNKRNACYILPNNPRKFYPLVDDKLKTKELLEKNNIPTPKLYFQIHYNFEIPKLRALDSYPDFVIKPARGAEGRGILVMKNKTEKGWAKASGEVLTLGDLEYHVSNTLAGLYSLGGQDDSAFVEQCVHSHTIFEEVAYRGVPDVRIILYHGIPVMSMLRIPTRESDGKANLHQGAVGAGIDMLQGITLGGVHHNKLLDIHPDTKKPIAGLKIPFWDTLLDISARTADIFKLGYFGVDFVIDEKWGPLILELNARPGLNIQLANRTGILHRLKGVDAMKFDFAKLSWKDRVDISRSIVSKFSVA